MDVRLDVFGHGRKFIVRAHLIFSALAITQHRLRGLLVTPEIRGRDARFEGFQALAMLRGVKDNSAQA